MQAGKTRWKPCCASGWNALALPSLDAAAAWSDAPPAKLALFSPSDTHAPSNNGHGDNEIAQLKTLLSYVQCQDTEVLPVLRDWLTHVYAVADVAQGYAQRAQLPAGGWFVTPQGHLIGAHSVLFHAPDSQLHGVLARQREIEKLELELIEQNRNAEYSRVQLAQAEQHYQSIDIQIAPLRAAGNELQQRLHGLQMNILKLNQAHERSVERAAQIEREMQEAAELLVVEQNQQRGVDEQMVVLREQIRRLLYASRRGAAPCQRAGYRVARATQPSAAGAARPAGNPLLCQDLHRKDQRPATQRPADHRCIGAVRAEPGAIARRPVGQRG